MNATNCDMNFKGYSDEIRVNFHVDNKKNDMVSEPSKVKFSCRHKSYPHIDVIMSLSIGAVEAPSVPSAEKINEKLFFSENQSSILTIEGLCIVDPQHKLSQLSDEVLQNLLSSILFATFEYSKSHSIQEWLIAVKPEFDEELTEIGVSHQRYSFDNRGRCIIGVLPVEFLSKGKQLIDSWTRRMFECKPLLN